MKKLIFIASLLITAPGVTAAFDCSGKNEQDCTATAGCTFTGLSGCRQCDNGTYSLAGDNECKDCTIPPNAKATGAGDDKTKCPWILTCQKNQYWDGSNCQKCPDNYHNDTETSVSYAGTSLSWPAATSCTGNIYQIILDAKVLKNFIKKEDEQKIYYVKYGNGFSESKDGPFGPWSQSWAYGLSSPCINTTGYSLNKIQYIDGNGELVVQGPYTAFTQDTTLNVTFIGSSYTVKYNKTLNAKEEKCSFGEDCKIADIKLEELYLDQPDTGYVLIGWEYTGPDGQNYTGKPGESLQVNQCPKNSSGYTITLNPQLKKCQAGKYCDASGEHDCPLGSTSDDGADSPAKCYYNNTIKFTDTNHADKHFTLPENIKVYYIPN